MGNSVTLLANVRVFATYPHNCSYLAGEQATTLFVDPSTPIDARIYSQLSYIGFRRSGPHLYRPHCAACNACVPARVPVEAFTPNRGQRRILARNGDLEAQVVDSIHSGAHFALIIGDDEAQTGQATLKPLRGGGEQVRVAQAELPQVINKQINKMIKKG